MLPPIQLWPGQKDSARQEGTDHSFRSLTFLLGSLIFNDCQHLFDLRILDHLVFAAQPLDFNLVNLIEPAQSEHGFRRRLRKVRTRNSYSRKSRLPRASR